MTTAFREEVLNFGPKIDLVNSKLGIRESWPLPLPYRCQVKASIDHSVFKIESQIYAFRTGLQFARLTRCEGHQQTC